MTSGVTLVKTHVCAVKGLRREGLEPDGSCEADVLKKKFQHSMCIYFSSVLSPLCMCVRIWQCSALVGSIFLDGPKCLAFYE